MLTAIVFEKPIWYLSCLSTKYTFYTRLTWSKNKTITRLEAQPFIWWRSSSISPLKKKSRQLWWCDLACCCGRSAFTMKIMKRMNFFQESAFIISSSYLCDFFSGLFPRWTPPAAPPLSVQRQKRLDHKQQIGPIFLHHGRARYQSGFLNYRRAAACSPDSDGGGRSPLNPPSTVLPPPVVCAGRGVEGKWWRLHNRYLPPPLLTAGNSVPRQKLFRRRSWLWRLIECGWMWPSFKSKPLHDSVFNSWRIQPISLIGMSLFHPDLV